MPYWRFPAAWSTPLLTAAMLCLVPVWRTIALGQVNVLLMAMVAVDVLAVTARGSRWGGLLTGVAAAVKLVPLIFIAHLLLTGKRTAAARALAVFAGLQGLRSPSPRGIRLLDVLRVSDRQDRRGGATLQPVFRRAYHAGDRGGPVVRARRMARRRRARGSRAAAGAPLPPAREGPGSLVRDRVLRAAAGAGFLGAVLGVDSTGPGSAVFLVAGMWRQAGRERWAGAGAMIAVIAVFTNLYTVSISQQRHRTLGSLWFFVLSNPYVLTTIAIALVLGANSWLRWPPGRPFVEPGGPIHR